ncbi:MAG: hypothetical protein RIB63_13795, partial [Fulvivirga sp.]
MINLKPYLLGLFLITATSIYGQKRVLPDDITIFGDSVSTLLNNTGGATAREIGDNFALIWSQLGDDQKKKVVTQMQAMEAKGYKLRPYQEVYCAVLVNAIQVEAADNQKITDYLNTADRVIATYDNEQTIKFLRFSNSLFKNRALFFAKSNNLYIGDADYYFEFVEPPVVEEVVEEVEEPAEDEWFEDFDEEPADEDWDTEWDDDEWEEEEYVDDYEEQSYDEDQAMIDAVRGSVVMPIIEGAVVRFEKVSLNFKTPYDSVFLSNTSGDYIVNSNTFVGKGGKFDWSMAGLSPDTVFASLAEYSFDVSKPQLKAESVKLTDKLRLNDPVEGVFEYKSVKHDSANSK